MDTPSQESRTLTVSAAVSPEEREAAKLAVRIDKLGSISEALRKHTLQYLIDRGIELEARLHEMESVA